MHGSAATLTNYRACAQLEETLLGSGLSSSAYGNKNTIFVTARHARGSAIIWCHGLRLGTTLPHAPGVRMT